MAGRRDAVVHRLCLSGTSASHWRRCNSMWAVQPPFASILQLDDRSKPYLYLAVSAVGPLLFDGIGTPQRLLSTGSPLPLFESFTPSIDEVISYNDVIWSFLFETSYVQQKEEFLFFFFLLRALRVDNNVCNRLFLIKNWMPAAIIGVFDIFFIWQ